MYSEEFVKENTARYKNDINADSEKVEKFEEMSRELGLRTDKIDGLPNKKYVWRCPTESYYEFVTNAVNRKTRSGKNSSHHGSEDFTGTADMEETLEYATRGWDYGVKELPIEEGVFESGTVEYTPSVCGGVVNLDNYLMGLPDSMFEVTDMREYNLPELTLYCDVSYLAVVSTKEALAHCKTLVDYINKMSTTHNVKVIGMMNTSYHNYSLGCHTYDMMEIVIKDFDQRLVINSIAFAFHPSFFRRLGFARYEEIWGLGSGYGSDFTSSELKAFINRNSNRGKVQLVLNCTTTRGKLDIEKHILDIK